MILADIGNSRVHIQDGGKIYHLNYKEAISRYSHKQVYYICVNSSILKSIKSFKNWVDISPLLTMQGFYDGMGVDRRALALSKGDGLYIDAGSAITIDIVKDNRYQGGTILVGISTLKSSYANISDKLSIEPTFNYKTPPIGTKAQIGYGIIAPIITLISDIRQDLNVWICGGDGRFLSQFIKDSIYDERLVFQGMAKALADNKDKGIE